MQDTSPKTDRQKRRNRRIIAQRLRTLATMIDNGQAEQVALQLRRWADRVDPSQR